MNSFSPLGKADQKNFDFYRSNSDIYTIETCSYRYGTRRGFLNQADVLQPGKTILQSKMETLGSPIPLLEEGYEQARQEGIDQLLSILGSDYKVARKLLQSIRNTNRESTKFSQLKELGSGVTPRQAWSGLLMANMLDILGPDTGSYTNEYGLFTQRSNFSQILNQRIEQDILGPSSVMFTFGGTEAISLITRYCAEQGKEVLMCGPGYFKAYDSTCIVKTLFCAQMQESGSQVFRTLPTAQEIEESIAQNPALGALMITQPSLSGEVYDDIEIQDILRVAKASNLLIIIDGAFEGLEEDAQYDFLRFATQNNYLKNVLRFSSLSKPEGLASPRLGFLAGGDEKIIACLSDEAGKYRDGLNLNRSLLDMSNVLFFVKTAVAEYKRMQQNIDTTKISSDIYDLFTSETIGSLQIPLTKEVVDNYLSQKCGDMKAYIASMNFVKSQAGKGLISSMSDTKCYFNSLIKIDENIINPKKYKIEDIIRLSFLMDGNILAVGQNFGGDKDFMNRLPLILRATVTTSPTYLQACLQSTEYVLGNINNFTSFVK